MIIDCHTHLASPTQLPEEFFDGWTKTIVSSLPAEAAAEKAAALKGLFARVNSDAKGEALLREMDEAGIDKAILLVVDFGLAFQREGSSLEALHEEVLSVTSSGDRFVAFAGVDPRRGQAGVDWFEHCVQRGFAGLKLYPPCGFSPSDPSLDPYYEICRAHGLPVLTHTGPTSSVLPFKQAHPLEVDMAACRFPEVNFILAHGAVMWSDEATRIAEHRPNVYLDVSGFQSELKGGGFDALLTQHLRRKLSHRLLFGTDWPIHRLFGTQKSWVNAIDDVVARKVITSADADNLFYANITRLVPRLGARVPSRTSSIAAPSIG